MSHTHDSITAAVHKLVREQGCFDPEQEVTVASVITSDANGQTSELGLDSLDHVEIIMSTEDAFDIEITDQDAEKLTTVGALIAHVVKAKGLEPQA